MTFLLLDSLWALSNKLLVSSVDPSSAITEYLRILFLQIFRLPLEPDIMHFHLIYRKQAFSIEDRSIWAYSLSWYWKSLLDFFLEVTDFEVVGYNRQPLRSSEVFLGIYKSMQESVWVHLLQMRHLGICIYCHDRLMHIDLCAMQHPAAKAVARFTVSIHPPTQSSPSTFSETLPLHIHISSSSQLPSSVNTSLLQLLSPSPPVSP